MYQVRWGIGRNYSAITGTEREADSLRNALTLAGWLGVYVLDLGNDFIPAGKGESNV